MAIFISNQLEWLVERSKLSCEYEINNTIAIFTHIIRMDGADEMS